MGRPGGETVWLALTTDRTWQVLAWLSMIACCLPGLAFLCALTLIPKLPHVLHILCHRTLALQPSPEHPSCTVFPCPVSSQCPCPFSNFHLAPSFPSTFPATPLSPLPYLSPRYVVAWRGRLLPPKAPLLLLPACFGPWQKPHLLTPCQEIGK